jgi:hypothetical protein
MGIISAIPSNAGRRVSNPRRYDMVSATALAYSGSSMVLVGDGHVRARQELGKSHGGARHGVTTMLPVVL